jgi:hypothetical protein
MRTRLKNSSEVMHVWAQQTQPEGHCSNVFFRDKSIFSYGDHFEMARFITKNVVLITTRTYSVTTAGHLSGVRSAVSHLKTYKVPTFDDHKANAQAYLTDLAADLYKISRMRSGLDFWLERYQAKAKEAAEYVLMFKKQVGAKLYREVISVYGKSDNPLTADQVAKFKAQAAQEREANKARKAAQAKAKAERLAKHQEALDLWAAGGQKYYVFGDLPVRLRIMNDEIQTSRGAEVPLIEARKLWRAIQTLAKNGTGPAIEGMRVGHYTVTTIRDGALIVGCHTIPLREVYKMAKALKWDTSEMEVA